MPRGDGTGSSGKRGQGRGRMGGSFAAGSGGNCICSKCGYKAPHSSGQPCNSMVCPECGFALTRELS